MELSDKLTMALLKVQEAAKAQRPLRVSNKTTPHTIHNWTADALYRRGLIRYSRSLSLHGSDTVYSTPEGDAYFEEGLE